MKKCTKKNLKNRKKNKENKKKIDYFNFFFSISEYIIFVGHFDTFLSEKIFFFLMIYNFISGMFEIDSVKERDF